MIAVTAIRKHWLLAAAVFVTCVSMGLFAAMQIKPKFESEASLLVQLGRESAGLDPTATTSEITPIYETREQELNSALQVMQSRKLLEAVLGVIGEDVIMHPENFDFDRWKLALAETDWPELDPGIIHRSNKSKEISVEKLYRSITLETSQSSSVMGVTSTALTPDLAQAITRTMLEAFQVEHVRLNKSRGFDFFNQQVQLLQKQLDEARQAVSERKSELGVMTIEGERARLEDTLTAIEKELNTVIPGLAGSEAAVEIYRRSIETLPERTQPHDASDTLHKKLHELQQQRVALLRTFTPQHFRVKAVDEDIQLLNRQLKDPASRNAANPTLRELEVAHANEKAKVAQLTASIVELKNQQGLLRLQLSALTDAEAGMSKLKDTVNELMAAKVKATVKLEQARMLDQLSKDRISNIRVVQPPTFNPTSMSPSRSLVAIGGAIVGVVAAFVIPAVIEFALWYLQILKRENSEDSEGLIPCG